MNDFLSSAATLTVDIGSGWISRFDAGTLKAGDVVMADEEAGSAQRARLNGEYLCEASLSVVNDRFFARIERLEPDAPPPPPPERGDEATEVLPFAIRVASILTDLGQMSGLGRLSFIDLDKDFDVEEDVELVVADCPIAAGKTVVIGERFGIRITRRLADGFEEPEMRTTGAVLDDRLSAERVKDYDYLRPDCFSMRGILKAKAIHLEFLRTLAVRMPSAAALRLSRVDQLAYYEWAEASGPGDRSYALLETVPARAKAEGGSSLPSKLLLRPASAARPLDPSIVDSLRAAAERSSRPKGARPVIASLDARMRALLDEDRGLTITADCLRNGWKRVADLRVAPATGFRREVPGDEAAYRGEMILFVRVEGPEGAVLDLVYPLRCLEACFAALNA